MKASVQCKAANEYTCPAIGISYVNIGALGPELHDDCIVPQSCGVVQGSAASMVHAIHLYSSHAAELGSNAGVALMRRHVQGCQALQPSGTRYSIVAVLGLLLAPDAG